MKRNQITLAAIAAAALLAAGCDKEVEKTQLQVPTISVTFADSPVNARIEWSDDANAKCWSWKLSESANPTATLSVSANPSVIVEQNASYTNNLKIIKDLKENTEYTFTVTAIAADGSNYLNSEEATANFTTGIIPRAETPVFRTNAVTDKGVCVTWSVVEGASYKYRITTKADPSTNLNSDVDKTFTDPFVTLSGLTAATAYVIHVQAISDEEGVQPSPEAEFEFTTEAEATDPWVAVAFEYRVFAEKNTLIVHNVPNSKAANYYTTTENENVIGEGLATESVMAYYIVSDYEEHVPGVYMNSSIHKFNDNGQGWNAGDNLFYAAVGETKNGDTKLNWFWLEMPEKPGDDVKILDSPKK